MIVSEQMSWSASWLIYFELSVGTMAPSDSRGHPDQVLHCRPRNFQGGRPDSTYQLNSKVFQPEAETILVTKAASRISQETTAFVLKEPWVEAFRLP